MKKLLAAAYARYSTDLQTDNSIAYQFSAIEKYAKNHNLSIVDKFSDEALSGVNINRPGFLELKKNALEGKYEAIVIYDITRLNRNVGDWMDFHKLMTDLNVKILSPTQRIGSFYNPNDFLMGGMNALIGEHFVLVTREKTIAGLKERASNSKFNGGVPPYGYDVDKEGNYIINEAEADIIRQIFKMYISGVECSEIIKAANDMGYVGRRGGKLSKGTLNGILKNEKYIGTYIYNEYQHRVLSTKVGSIKNPEEEVIRIPNGIPAIIDKNSWNVAKQRLSKRMAKFASNESYPLKGLIYCGTCGNQYRGERNINSRGYGGRYYRCGGKRDKKVTCNNIGVRAEIIEGFVKDALNKHFFKYNVSKMVDLVIIEFNNRQVNQNDILTIKKEMNEIDKKLNNITLAIEQGIIYDGLLDKVNTLKNRRSKLLNFSKELNKKPDLPSRQFITDKLSYFRNTLNSTDTNEYYIGVRNAVKKIIIENTGDVNIYIRNLVVVLESSEKRIRTADLSGMNRTL